jgi:PAS domain S-box-containing protein
MWFPMDYVGMGEPTAPFLLLGRIGSLIMPEAGPEEPALVALRWRGLVEKLPHLVWCADGSGNWLWASPQWIAVTGQPLADSLGNGWLDAVHPDDRAAAVIAWIGARTADALNVDFRVYHAATQGYRWHSTRATPIRAENGRDIVEWVGATIDIHDLRQAEAAQRALVDELDHRIRNLFSFMRAMVRRSAQENLSTDEIVSSLLSRIDAFARVQLMMAGDPVGDLDLARLVAEEVNAFGYGASVLVGGPPARLPLRAGELLSLTIHELLMNAVRHRTISGGLVRISWSLEPHGNGGLLVINWQEQGVHTDAHLAEEEGFGFELLRRTLPYELGAKTHVSIAPPNLDIEIALPL